MTTLSECALRACHCRILGPLVASTSAPIDATIALGLWVASLGTAGRFEGPVCSMQRGFRSLEFLPCWLFASLIQTLTAKPLEPVMGRTDSFASRCWEVYESQDPSRKGLVILAVRLVIARALDAVVGFCALVVSLLCLGSNQRANEVAYNHLTGFFGLVMDVTTISVKLFNPQVRDIYS